MELTSTLQSTTPTCVRASSPAEAKTRSRGISCPNILGALGAEGLFHCCMAVTVITIVSVMPVMLTVASISVPFTQMLGAAGKGLIVFGLAAGYCQYRGYAKLRDGILIMLWACILSQLLVFPMYAAARLHFPLRDHLFASIDSQLGLEVPLLLAKLSHYPRISVFLSHIYATLWPLMIAAVTVPAMAGKHRVAKEFVVANIVATVTGFAAFAVLPGFGPWAAYGLPPSVTQMQFSQTLEALRHAGAFAIDPRYSTGLICFPSFHVILAILCAAAFWPWRALRPVVGALSALIVISAVSTGWHYTVDVLGGIVFAAASIAAAKGFTRVEIAVIERSGAARSCSAELRQQ